MFEVTKHMKDIINIRKEVVSALAKTNNIITKI